MNVLFKCQFSSKPEKVYNDCELAGLAKLLAFGNDKWTGLVLREVNLEENYAAFLTTRRVIPPYSLVVLAVPLICFKEALGLESILVRLDPGQEILGVYEFIIGSEAVKSLIPIVKTREIDPSILAKLAMFDSHFRVKELCYICKDLYIDSDYVNLFKKLYMLAPTAFPTYKEVGFCEDVPRTASIVLRAKKFVQTIMGESDGEIDQILLELCLKWMERNHEQVSLEEIGCEDDIPEFESIEIDDLFFPEREFIARLKTDKELRERIRVIHLLDSKRS